MSPSRLDTPVLRSQLQENLELANCRQLPQPIQRSWDLARMPSPTSSKPRRTRTKPTPPCRLLLRLRQMARQYRLGLIRKPARRGTARTKRQTDPALASPRYGHGDAGLQ